jgi:hypothetical protein
MKPLFNNSSLTNMINKQISHRFINVWYYIPALIANIFSIIFSLSIVLELKNIITNIYVLILLSVFVILFLVYNEVTKVQYVRKVFKGVKSAIIPLIITFIISLTLASIGIWLFTNKSIDINNNNNMEKVVKINDISYKYQTKINDINNNMVYETSKEYQSLNNELYYWKHVTSATLIERNDIRNRIDKIQNDIQSQRTIFNENKRLSINQLNTLLNNEINIVNTQYNNNTTKSNKNNFISYIFLSLIIITEFATIVLNKNIAEKQILRDEFLNNNPIVNKYIISKNILTSIYLTSYNNTTNIEKAKYSDVNKFEWNDLSLLYNQFINLGILDPGEIIEHKSLDKEYNEKIKKVLTNKFMVNEVEAQHKLDSYFEKLLNMKS